MVSTSSITKSSHTCHLIFLTIVDLFHDYLESTSSPRANLVQNQKLEANPQDDILVISNFSAQFKLRSWTLGQLVELLRSSRFQGLLSLYGKTWNFSKNIIWFFFLKKSAYSRTGTTSSTLLVDTIHEFYIVVDDMDSWTRLRFPHLFLTFVSITTLLSEKVFTRPYFCYFYKNLYYWGN